MEYIITGLENSAATTNNMDAFRLQLPQVSESFLVHNRSLSQIDHRSVKPLGG